MPTLQELAAAQVANPNNPYLNTTHVNTPEEDAAFYAPTPAAGNILPSQPLPPVTTPEQDAKFYAPPGPTPPITAGEGENSPSYNPGNFVTTPPNSATMYKGTEKLTTGEGVKKDEKKVPGATPLITTGVKSSTSPEEINLKENMGIRGERSKILGKEQEINDRNMQLSQIAHDAAQRKLEGAEYIKAANDVENKQDQWKFEQNAQERARQLDAEAAEVRAKKVDPQHWYKERGTVGSILAAISMAAGAFAAAMPHTNSNKNFAGEIIENSINRDIQSQEKDIDNAWESLKFHGSQDEKEYARGQFDLRSKRDLRQQQYDHTLTLINNQMAQTNDQIAINNLGKLAGEIQNKKLDLQKQDADQKMQVTQYLRAKAAAAAAQNTVSPKEITKLAAELYSKGGMTEEEAVRKAQALLTGGKGTGQAIAGANAHADKVAPLNQLMHNVDRAEKDYAKGGALEGTTALGSAVRGTARKTVPGKVTIPEDQLQAEQNFDVVLNAYMNQMTGAGMSEKEAARLSDSIKGDGSAEARRHGLQIIREGINSQLKTYGSKVPDEVKGATPYGE